MADDPKKILEDIISPEILFSRTDTEGFNRQRKRFLTLMRIAGHDDYDEKEGEFYRNTNYDSDVYIAEGYDLASYVPWLLLSLKKTLAGQAEGSRRDPWHLIDAWYHLASGDSPEEARKKAKIALYTGDDFSRSTQGLVNLIQAEWKFPMTAHEFVLEEKLIRLREVYTGLEERGAGSAHMTAAIQEIIPDARIRTRGGRLSLVRFPLPHGYSRYAMMNKAYPSAARSGYSISPYMIIKPVYSNGRNSYFPVGDFIGFSITPSHGFYPRMLSPASIWQNISGHDKDGSANYHNVTSFGQFHYIKGHEIGSFFPFQRGTSIQDNGYQVRMAQRTNQLFSPYIRSVRFLDRSENRERVDPIRRDHHLSAFLEAVGCYSLM